MSTKEEKQEALYKELIKLSKKANQRIARIERVYGEDSWAVSRLRDRLDTEVLNAWTLRGRIKTNKLMSITQLRAVIKATNQFLNSKTSTLRGIKDTTKKIKEGLKKSFSSSKKINDEDVERIYSIFGDNKASSVIEYIPASDVIAVIDEAREMNIKKDDFVNMLLEYIEVENDTSIIADMEYLYDTYVKEG